MLAKRNLIFQNLYTSILVLVVMAMPTSNFAISISQILLLAVWLVEGNFAKKLKRLKQNPAVLLFVGFYLLHILWLANTTELHWGFRDLQLKFPLLVMPLVFGSIRPIPVQKLSLVLHFFVATMLITGLMGFVNNYFLTQGVPDRRQMSLFLSHIRFSLMLNMALVFSIIFLLKNKQDRLLRIIYALSVLALFSFIVLLQSLTGLVVLAALFALGTLYLLKHCQMVIVKRTVLLSLLSLFAFFCVSAVWSVNKYYSPQKPDVSTLPKKTANGNAYFHSQKSKLRENSHFVYLYFCDKELNESWQYKSSIPIQGKDNKGNLIKWTLVRYLSSKGLTKDSVGVSQLTEQDVVNIQSGIASVVYTQKWSVYTFFYPIIWQADRYALMQNPNGHSITQRIEYVKTGWAIFKQNMWFGVGQGDLRKAFSLQYKADNSPLNAKNRYRTHNQYLTFFTAFGVVGGVLIMLSLILPVYLNRKAINVNLVAFLIIATLSMLNEDTLETSAGVMFFGFFYSLLFLKIKEHGKTFGSYYHL